MMRAGLVVLAFVLACGAPKPPPATPMPATDPTPLVPSETLGRPFVVQQKLRGRHGDRDVSLDAVVQLADGTLTLLGLTPFGSRAFVLTQRGTELRLDKLVDRELPFDPSYVLRDVHRVFFRGLPSPQPDGTHVHEAHGERITERWAGGVLVERRFERMNGEPPGAVVVHYAGAPSPVVAPHVTLENGWFGYTIELDNVAQRWLTE